MHWASKRNLIKVVEYLLEIGAFSDVVNNDDKTPDFYTVNNDIKKLLKPGNLHSISSLYIFGRNLELNLYIFKKEISF